MVSVGVCTAVLAAVLREPLRNLAVEGAYLALMSSLRIMQAPVVRPHEDEGWAGPGAFLAQWGPRRCAVHSAVGTKGNNLKSSQGKFEVLTAAFFQSEADSKAPFDLFDPVHWASLIVSGRLVTLTLR